MTLLRFVFFLLILSAAAKSTKSFAQQAEADVNGIKAVFRISKQFLDEAIDEQISAQVPINVEVIGFRCCGTIVGQADVFVELQDQGREAVFAIKSVGHGKACVTGRRGPVVAYGSAWGPFTTKTLVKFDGRQFSHQVTTPFACVCGKLIRVTGRRDRRIGRIFGRGITPIANRMVPRAVMEAVPIANRYLKEFVEQTAYQVISKLNKKTPLEETVNRVFPGTSDWKFQVSSTTNYIQSAYGPQSAKIPTLVRGKENWDKINVQIWLRSTNEEARSLARLSKLPLAKELLKKYILSTIPELDRFGKKRTIEAVEGWVLITFEVPEAG